MQSKQRGEGGEGPSFFEAAAVAAPAAAASGVEAVGDDTPQCNQEDNSSVVALPQLTKLGHTGD